MLEIKQNRWRMGVRLVLKAGIIAGILYLTFWVVFGLARGVGGEDGSLLLFCRVCRNYSAGDAMMMDDGSVVEYGENEGGMVAGKVIAILSIRGFVREVGE